jgi:hypothetical protein
MRERAKSVVEEGIRFSATIPSIEESRRIFGIDLAEKKIQPVWVEIDNATNRLIYFLRTGLDPEYFSPREIAFAMSESMTLDARRHLVEHVEALKLRDPIEPGTTQSLVEHVEALKLRDPIEPGTTQSGFIFTNRDRESKFLGVDLLSQGWSTHMTLVVSIPDRSLSEEKIQGIYTRIAETSPVRVDTESKLRELLEKLPCCAADENGVQGEPLNVVLIGTIEATGTALVRRGFHYAPASSMYVFGRPQDLSLKKGTSAWVPAQPHVLRVWLTNIRFEGKFVWIGQVSMPLGGRFGDAAMDARVSVIDPDVDTVRNDFLQDSFYSQRLAEIGFVKGVGPVAIERPRTTPGGSTYHTDGLRVVVIYAEDPLSLTEIEFIGWERLLDHRPR